jgi:hypothetical protein
MRLTSFHSLPLLLPLLLALLVLGTEGCAGAETNGDGRGGAKPGLAGTILYQTERAKPGHRPTPGMRPPTEPVTVVFSTAVGAGIVEAGPQPAKFQRDPRTGVTLARAATVEIPVSREGLEVLVGALEKDGLFAVHARTPPGPGESLPPRSILVSTGERRFFAVRDDQLADKARLEAFVRAERTLISCMR